VRQHRDKTANVLEVQIMACIHDQPALFSIRAKLGNSVEQTLRLALPMCGCIVARIAMPSAPASAARAAMARLGSTNRMTREPNDFSCLIGCASPAISAASKFHPLSEVNAVAASGTSVHCSGRTGATKSRKSGVGLPSTLYSNPAAKRRSPLRVPAHRSAGYVAHLAADGW
jgi:hypothetical protein